MFRNGDLRSDHQSAGAASTPGLRRQRREHRNAQILADLVSRLLDAGVLGTKHAQRPHLTVTVHADDYATGLGGDIMLPGFGAVPVPNTTIDRLLCDAEVHPVLTRRPGAPPGSPGRPDDPAPPPIPFPGAVPRSTDPPWRPAMRPREDGRSGWEYDALLEREPTRAEIDADTDVAAISEFGADLDDPVSAWNRLLGEPGRTVLDVGRSSRTAPPKLRRALAVRDGGCAVSGCDVDASRCEAHHITYWEHHGETAISNLVLLCAQHHHMVHEGRWRILRNTALDPGDPAYVILVTPAPHP